MSFKHRLLLLYLAGVLLATRSASACSCDVPSTVLAAYEQAAVVVVARAVSVEKAGPGEGANGISSTRLIIEKIFKGALKVGDELSFGQGPAAVCLWAFDKPVGQRFLLYLGPRVDLVMLCGRSAGVQSADDPTDDLLYLNRLKEVGGKTRLSGTIRFGDGSAVSVEGRSIRIAGGGKSYEVKTNKNGVYEIYDLPAGKYLIEPEIPMGWKMSEPWLRSSSPGDRPGRYPEKIPVVLEDKRHAGIDIYYEAK